MKLGWIDFSKNERNKVLSVLDLLAEAGTLDELGISPIRDAYANLFFPATSTIQTKAKYFLCVPYAFKDLEKGNYENFNSILKALNEKEKQCGEQLYLKTPNADGIIGASVIRHGSWVKRQPSEIYWGGIRRLGIFVGGNMSISEYLRFISGNTNQKNTIKRLGNHNDTAEENQCDDSGAGQDTYKRFWNLPTYKRNWLENICIDLTKQEAIFLKNQVILNCKGSMFAEVMSNDLTDFVDIKGFEQLGAGYIKNFPQDIQDDYFNAVAFSEFVYVLRVLYNMIVSNGENQQANEEWSKIESNLQQLASLDIVNIYNRLDINNLALKHFLLTAQRQMLANDIDGLQDTIIRREVQLKGASRAKTKHAGEFDKNAWFGGKKLDYRFPDAQTIMRDIFEGEQNGAES